MHRPGLLAGLCLIIKLCCVYGRVKFGIWLYLVSDSTNRFCAGSIMEFGGGESSDGVNPKEKNLIPLSTNYKAPWGEVCVSPPLLSQLKSFLTWQMIC